MRLLRSTLRTLLIALLLAGWGLALAAVHIVRLPEGHIGLVPKDRLGVADTYVDVRSWTAADAAEHPAFVKRLLEAHKADWLSTAVGVPGAALDAKLDDLLKAATPASPDPATKPTRRGKSVAKGPH